MSSFPPPPPPAGDSPYAPGPVPPPPPANSGPRHANVPPPPPANGGNIDPSSPTQNIPKVAPPSQPPAPAPQSVPMAASAPAPQPGAVPPVTGSIPTMNVNQQQQPAANGYVGDEKQQRALQELAEADGAAKVKIAATLKPVMAPSFIFGFVGFFLCMVFGLILGLIMLLADRVATSPLDFIARIPNLAAFTLGESITGGGNGFAIHFPPLFIVFYLLIMYAISKMLYKSGKRPTDVVSLVLVSVISSVIVWIMLAFLSFVFSVIPNFQVASASMTHLLMRVLLFHGVPLFIFAAWRAIVVPKLDSELYLHPFKAAVKALTAQFFFIVIISPLVYLGVFLLRSEHVLHELASNLITAFTLGFNIVAVYLFSYVNGGGTVISEGGSGGVHVLGSAIPVPGAMLLVIWFLAAFVAATFLASRTSPREGWMPMAYTVVTYAVAGILVTIVGNMSASGDASGELLRALSGYAITNSSSINSVAFVTFALNGALVYLLSRLIGPSMVNAISPLKKARIAEHLKVKQMEEAQS